MQQQRSSLSEEEQVFTIKTGTMPELQLQEWQKLDRRQQEIERRSPPSHDDREEPIPSALNWRTQSMRQEKHRSLADTISEDEDSPIEEDDNQHGDELSLNPYRIVKLANLKVSFF